MLQLFYGNIFFGSTRTDPNFFVALNITRKCFAGVIFHLVFQKKKLVFLSFFLFSILKRNFSVVPEMMRSSALPVLMYFKESNIF